jgi:hypothetical protein
MIDIVEIRAAIVSGRYSNDEINTIADAIRFARAQMTKQKTRAFRPGDAVQFTSNRNGMTYRGVVDKVKIKYVLVRTANTLFNVPANMLEAV